MDSLDLEKGRKCHKPNRKGGTASHIKVEDKQVQAGLIETFSHVYLQMIKEVDELEIIKYKTSSNIQLSKFGNELALQGFAVDQRDDPL